jgi:hypothetical protein
VEYIVVDPGSTDGSVEFLSSKRDQIDKLILEPDTGPAAGLNRGFQGASGEWGYFLNSDDAVLPRVFEKIEQVKSSHPSVDVILTDAWMVDEHLLPMRRLTARRPTTKTLALGLVPMIQQGMFFRLEAFRRIGGFNVHNKTCWDGELLIDLLSMGAKVCVLNEATALFRIHHKGLSGGGGGMSHQQKYFSDRKRLAAKFSNTGFWATKTGERCLRVAKFAADPLRGTEGLLEERFARLAQANWRREFSCSSPAHLLGITAEELKST